MSWRLAAPLAGLMACRFGGPWANPDAYVSFPDAAEPSVTTSNDDGSVSSREDATPPASGDDAGAPGSVDGGDFDALDDDAGHGGACSQTVAVCDPVHNTGCNALQQCDVNPLQTSTPTGQCVFGGSAEGGVCLASIFTESCAPHFTCLDGGCRQLCFCNADCPVGQCCSDTSGPPGFTLCGACP